VSIFTLHPIDGGSTSLRNVTNIISQCQWVQPLSVLVICFLGQDFTWWQFPCASSEEQEATPLLTGASVLRDDPLTRVLLHGLAAVSRGAQGTRHKAHLAASWY
jgi:hypothetical protein